MKTKIMPDIYMTLIVTCIILSGILAIYITEPMHNSGEEFFIKHFSLSPKNRI